MQQARAPFRADQLRYKCRLQEAEAGMKLGLARLCMGPGAVAGGRRLIYESLPLLMGATSMSLRAQAYMALAEVLLTSSSREDVVSDPNRWGPFCQRFCGPTYKLGLSGIWGVIIPLRFL